jgi:hypothetical protein
MGKIKKIILKKGLRSSNNCYKLKNIFDKNNPKQLCENFDYIPKHVRIRLLGNEIFTCKELN